MFVSFASEFKREVPCSSVPQPAAVPSQMLLCRREELGHMVTVTARRAMGHLCRAPRPVVTHSRYKPQLLGASLRSLAGSYGVRRWASPWAFTGSADEGIALANIDRAKKLRRPGRPSVYLTLFWRGPEAAQLLLIQSLPILEVVI